MAEIKISDLSIGDWVMYRDREWQVCSLYKFTEEVGLLRKDSQFCEYVSDLHPILLTPEILKKNGWLPPRKAIELDTWWWTNGVDKAIEAYEYEGEWYLTIIEQKEIQYRNRVGIGLKYVHQLQHALRFAGVEKEIEV